jgi:DNA-binding transcriptional MocR family regulator
LKYFPSGTRVTRPDGGLFVWIELPDGLDADLLYRKAVQAGILFAPGTLFSIRNRYPHHLRLSFGTWNERVEKAIAHLGRLCARMQDCRSDDRVSRLAVG